MGPAGGACGAWEAADICFGHLLILLQIPTCFPLTLIVYSPINASWAPVGEVLS